MGLNDPKTCVDQFKFDKEYRQDTKNNIIFWNTWVRYMYQTKELCCTYTLWSFSNNT